MAFDDRWLHVGDVRNALAAGREHRGASRDPRSALVGGFDPNDERHRATLLALTSEERRALFGFGTRGNWGRHGLVQRTSDVARALSLTSDLAALVLFDDLVAVRGVAEEVHEAALVSVRRALGRKQPVRAGEFVARALYLGRQHPVLFHHALAIAHHLGDREAALGYLRHAARYGHDLERILGDAELKQVVADPDFASEIAALSRSRPFPSRATANLVALLPAASSLAAESPSVPTPKRVARRALLLAALAWRASLPNTAALIFPKDRADAETRRDEIVDWLSARAREEASADEWALLTSPLESTQSPEELDYSWAIEAAATLAYALGLSRAPQLEAKAEPEALVARLGLASAAGDELLDGATLVPFAELARHRIVTLSIDWRATEERVHPGPIDIAALRKSDPRLAALDFGRARLIEGDLAVAGKPISLAKRGKVDRLASLALERHRAADWLVGHGDGGWSHGLVAT